MGPDVTVRWARSDGGRRGRPRAFDRSADWAGLRAGRPALLAGLAAVLLAGCGLSIPAELRTPSVAGVVEEVTRLPDGRSVYRLQSGASAEIASQKTILLGGEPLVGELLLAGTDPDGRQWVAGVSGDWPGRPPGCFLFPARGRDAGDRIETTDGFRLPKAPDFFDPRSSDGKEFTSDQGVFCLDEDGEVTSYDLR